MPASGRAPGGVGETFMVNVKFLQNATWQGTVKWGPGGREIAFRSALELLKIMDKALEEQPGPAPPGTQQGEPHGK